MYLASWPNSSNPRPFFGGGTSETPNRRLTLTDPGQLVFGYAEEIFALGQELITALGQGTERTAASTAGRNL